LLEGESLLNDAAGLVALEFAVALTAHGQSPTFGSASLRLMYLIVAGLGSGLLLALIVEWFERRIDDGPIEIAISILVPYAAYLTAEAMHASGVLAVVAAGLYLGRKSSEFFSPRVRLQAQAFWDSITFILNGFVFILIGLQLPAVLAGVGELPFGKILLYGALFSLFPILLRLFWTFAGEYAAHFLQTGLLGRRQNPPDPRQIFVIGWTGMRGVIALAAAMSLPDAVADGSPFPHRDLIVFLTFCVILVTLVLQGLTLAPLIRILGLAETGPLKREDREARRLVLEAAQERLEDLRRSDNSGSAEVYDELALHYKQRLASVMASPGIGRESGSALLHRYSRYVDISRALLEAERRSALRLRDQGRIGDEELRAIENELDLSETRLAAAKDY
jgi:CPA1 family monovalent cation:H+ antiporter